MKSESPTSLLGMMFEPQNCLECFPHVLTSLWPYSLNAGKTNRKKTKKQNGKGKDDTLSRKYIDGSFTIDSFSFLTGP